MLNIRKSTARILFIAPYKFGFALLKIVGGTFYSLIQIKKILRNLRDIKICFSQDSGC